MRYPTPPSSGAKRLLLGSLENPLIEPISIHLREAREYL
jgi:hypothetical protein